MYRFLALNKRRKQTYYETRQTQQQAHIIWHKYFCLEDEKHRDNIFIELFKIEFLPIAAPTRVELVASSLFFFLPLCQEVFFSKPFSPPSVWRVAPLAIALVCSDCSPWLLPPWLTNPLPFFLCCPKTPQQLWPYFAWQSQVKWLS